MLTLVAFSFQVTVTMVHSRQQRCFIDIRCERNAMSTDRHGCSMVDNAAEAAIHSKRRTVLCCKYWIYPWMYRQISPSEVRRYQSWYRDILPSMVLLFLKKLPWFASEERSKACWWNNSMVNNLMRCILPIGDHWFNNTWWICHVTCVRTSLLDNHMLCVCKTKHIYDQCAI